jgi:hypothetical protein
MKKPTRQKTRNVFIGIVILAVLTGVAAWVYISVQSTTLAVTSDKPAYFTNDEPRVEIRVLNPKNATSGEVVINYPADNLMLEETETPENVSMRETEGTLYFEISPGFFANGDKTVANLTFSVLNTGEVIINADTDDSFLETPEGRLEFKRYDFSEFDIGLTEDIEEGEEYNAESGGTFDEI